MIEIHVHLIIVKATRDQESTNGSLCLVELKSRSIKITVVHSQTLPLSEQIMEPLGFNGNFHELELREVL